MAKKEPISFLVVGRVKRENSKGIVYQVKLRSKEGHRLILESDSSAIFDGFPVDDKVSVFIDRVQATLS